MIEFLKDIPKYQILTQEEYMALQYLYVIIYDNLSDYIPAVDLKVLNCFTAETIVKRGPPQVSISLPLSNSKLSTLA